MLVASSVGIWTWAAGMILLVAIGNTIWALNKGATRMFGVLVTAVGVGALVYLYHIASSRPTAAAPTDTAQSAQPSHPLTPSSPPTPDSSTATASAPDARSTSDGKQNSLIGHWVCSRLTHANRLISVLSRSIFVRTEPSTLLTACKNVPLLGFGKVLGRHPNTQST